MTGARSIPSALGSPSSRSRVNDADGGVLGPALEAASLSEWTGDGVRDLRGGSPL